MAIATAAIRIARVTRDGKRKKRFIKIYSRRQRAEGRGQKAPRQRAEGSKAEGRRLQGRGQKAPRQRAEGSKAEAKKIKGFNN
jgi:hypothetical protein